MCPCCYLHESKSGTQVEYTPSQTIDDYPGLFYHRVSNMCVLELMDIVRYTYHQTAKIIFKHCPHGRYRSLAMTDLESSLMRAIQSLAVQDPTTKVVP